MGVGRGRCLGGRAGGVVAVVEFGDGSGDIISLNYFKTNISMVLINY